MKRNEFYKKLEDSGVGLTSLQKSQFHRYFELLVEWNGFMNLTGITDEEGVYLKHFYDSLLPFIDDDNISDGPLKLCDIGSGAGFPGLPLKIVFPSLEIDLVDSLGKRIDFLNHVIKELELVGIRAHHARAEEFCKEHRESFDIVTSRAVARFSMLSELCAPLVRVGGKFIALKGAVAREEINEGKGAFSTLGLELVGIIDIELPYEAGTRANVYAKKINPTPKKYPRAFGQIKKAPLR